MTLTHATDDEAARIREEYDACIRASTYRSGQPVLHLPANPNANDSERLCGGHAPPVRGSDTFSRRPLAAYPEGWFRFCRYCVEMWRDRNRIGGGRTGGDDDTGCRGPHHPDDEIAPR